MKRVYILTPFSFFWLIFTLIKRRSIFTSRKVIDFKDWILGRCSYLEMNAGMRFYTSVESTRCGIGPLVGIVSVGYGLAQ